MEYVIKIKGKPYTQVTDYEIEYNQLWADGTGRNYGDYSWVGEVAGNFDKVNLAILPNNKQELSTLIKDLRSGMFDIEYYDHELMGMKKSRVYRANFKVKSTYISNLNTFTELVTLSFTPEKREESR